MRRGIPSVHRWLGIWPCRKREDNMPEPSSRRPTLIAMASHRATTSSSSIARRFDALRKNSRRALVCYVTAGRPHVAPSLGTPPALGGGGAGGLGLGGARSGPLARCPAHQANAFPGVPP